MPLESANHLLLESEPAWRRFVEEVEAFLPGATSGSASFAGLTPRERDLVELIAQGRDNAQIAATLGLSEKTVRNHITHIFAKLEVENRAQAIVLARNAGFGRSVTRPRDNGPSPCRPVRAGPGAGASCRAAPRHDTAPHRGSAAYHRGDESCKPPTPTVADKRYAKCIEVSKRIRWDIDRDVIRGRSFDLAQKFLPDGLSFAERLPFLDSADSAAAEPGAGPHLRQHVRPVRALHRRQDAGGQPRALRSATRSRSRRSSASRTRSSSTRSCSAASKR